MLTADTMRKVRMLSARGASLREVARRYNLSRNTVRKIVRRNAAELQQLLTRALYNS